MSDDIKQGDRAMLVRPTFCCGCEDLLGSVFEVEEVFDCAIVGFCAACGEQNLYGPGQAVSVGGGCGCDIRRLQKLPDLDDEIDQASYAQMLKEDERYRTLTETLQRAHALGARIKAENGL